MSGEEKILVSVVIPVKNGVYWLNGLLQSLSEQSMAHVMEIICIDSGSTDETINIIQKHGVRLLKIAPQEFNHGQTRNLGVQHAKGEYVVMTVQDAIPTDMDWIKKLLEGFVDETVAGVCGQQVVPHDRDKNPAQWFRPQSMGSVKKYHFADAAAFDALSPEAKKNICGWDDVTACYKKEILLKLPFRKVVFAEDALWAMDALKAGHSIVYNTHARVYHYHHETAGFALKRSLTVFYFRYKYFGYLQANVKPTIRQQLQLVKLLLKADIPLKEKIYWWKYNRNYYGATQKAFHMFTEALRKGEAAVESLHEKYCGTAPMAQKIESSDH